MKVATIFLILCLPLLAQETITINGTSLRLGMQKADVIELLGAENNISKLVGTLNWCVRPKSDRSKDQCPSHLYFKDDKLQAAQKTHGTAYGEDGAKVMNAFFTQM